MNEVTTSGLLLAKPDEAADFLACFQPGGPWYLAAIAEGQRLIGRTCETPEEVARVVAQYPAANLYFHVNKLKGSPAKGKATKSDVAAALYLHVDVDDPRPEVLAQIRAVRPQFTAIVASGGGGYHGYYKLAELYTDLSRIEKLNKALVRALKGDPACYNADRIMRLPGTLNVLDEKKRAKGRVPGLAHLVEADWSRTYSLDLLAAVLDNEFVRTLAAGEQTHDAALRFVGRLVTMTELNDDQIETIAASWFPPDYEGNTRDELPRMIRDARRKGFDRRGFVGAYDPGALGPVPLGYAKSPSAKF